jgi:cytochrome c oxidase assembly protein subunit 11
MSRTDAQAQTKRGGANTRVALICALVFFSMVGAAFAAVPLYRTFCAATGWNGAVKTVGVDGKASAVSSRVVSVRFDTNVRGLSWTFEPAQGAQDVHLGEHKLAFFRATNNGSVAVTGRASYNVAPETAGPYFSKLECFCFKNQTIQPGQTVEFPVVYIVDPRFADDPDNAGLRQITLSYTFFPSPQQETAGANGRASAPAGQAPRPLGGSAQAGL